MKSRARFFGAAVGAALIGVLALGGVALAQGTPIPHPIAGRENCLSCHPTSTLPADHANRTEATCAACHKEAPAETPVSTSEPTPEPTATPTGSAQPTAEPTTEPTEPSQPTGEPTAVPTEEPQPTPEPTDQPVNSAYPGAPLTPHSIAGREDCLVCHAYSTLPANHAGRPYTSCAACHPEAASTTPNGPTGALSDDDCLVCHSNPNLQVTLPGGKVLSLTVDKAQLDASVHGLIGVTCTECHTNIKEYPHPELTATDERDFTVQRSEACATCHGEITQAQHDSVHYRLLEEGNTNVPTCVDCHDGHDITPPDQPRFKLSLTCGQEGCHSSILATYETSVHGSVIAQQQDNPYVPVCEDCHGVHQMADPRTGDFRSASPELCATCHSDPNVVSSYGLSTDVYQDYEDGIHAQLAQQNPDIQTPVCTDCHGVHDVKSLRISTLVSSETCATCHSDIFDKYKLGVHGAALISGNSDVPGCTYCHSAHKIPDPTTPQFRLGEPDLCASCHSDPVLMAKYGLSPDVYVTYQQEFHGMTVELYKTKWANASIYCYEAVCTDCHGTHEILPASDPQSSVNSANLINACRQCHPDASNQFASAWTGHYKITQDRAPLTYYVNLFYTILIPTVIGGMVLFLLTDIGRRVFRRIRRGKSS